MLIIDDKLISLDILEKNFVCNLDACKGACCWEGDVGAPLDPQERDILERIYPDIRPYLDPRGIAAIEAEGTWVHVPEEDGFFTTLVNNAACAYLTYDAAGKAKCGIEKAYEAGATDFRKPLSCHLYPIRVLHLPEYDALNYDRWDICQAACTLGDKLQVPVYRFLKEALIRAYGEDFYEQLDAAAQDLT